ncbi:ROK family transcriptional regulator [Micromonospora sp. WMMA1949]|uniref:ROK family transcriptional regulator n=1 Tax=unclassified Micromonospora TaxID=2617518 RepID=UPI0022B71048|nr:MULTISPECIES: ROK family transcriptional regulator [unclassified Micromonospora]MCZ7429418.1 ROK family transcriptional regulator [Micromonospora sp. WMMA1949]WBC08276.1 ROK family transcriptional regulator [Micromonospora sp. WMMA1947]
MISIDRPTADLGDVRVTNRAAVLRHVRRHAPCSRADVAARTGLNKATVSSLVAELIEHGLLRETGLTENRVGRPATMLVLDGSRYVGLGLRVGADEMVAVAAGLGGDPVLTWRRAFPAATAGPEETVKALVALVRRAVTRVGADRTVLGLTVAVPGLVNPDGDVPVAPALGWRGVPLAASVRRALRDPGFPVAVDTEANLAVLAERRHGPYAATADLIHLTGGPSIGAGLISGGRLLRGGRGFAGEIGHLPLAADGPPCDCGRRGCLTALLGVDAVIGRLLPGDGPVTDHLPEIERIQALARAGEEPVRTGLTEIGRLLGQAVSVLSGLLDPEVVVVGGHLAALAPWLLPAAHAELAARTPVPPGVRLEASTLGSAAGALGGATAALATVEAGRLPAG